MGDMRHARCSSTTKQMLTRWTHVAGLLCTSQYRRAFSPAATMNDCSSVQKNHAYTVRVLLEKSADPSACTRTQKWTPLHLASSKNGWWALIPPGQ
eukprot:767903-Hanusia_phi.AAC.8